MADFFKCIDAIFGKTMHAKKVQSFVLHLAELILHKIGVGLVQAIRLNKKHTIK
jgi:hypothetical protein